MILDIDQVVEDRLRDQAGKRGLTAEQYALLILNVMVRTSPDLSDRRVPFQIAATDEEWEAEIQRMINDRDDSAPPIPIEALRREHIYEDQG